MCPIVGAILWLFGVAVSPKFMLTLTLGFVGYRMIFPSKKDKLALKYYDKRYWRLCPDRKRTINQLLRSAR